MKRHTSLVILGVLPFALRPAAARAQATGTPYKIGLTFPLTGVFADTASENIRASEIAVQEINNAGGIKGHPLMLVTEDTQATPAGGIAAMRKLAQVDGVQCILTIYTNVVTAQIPLADELKIPVLALMEVPGVMNRGQYTFAHSPTILGAAILIRDQFKAAGYKRISALLVNGGYGAAASPVLKAAAQNAGAQYDEAYYNPGNETDYRGLVIRVRDAKPDAVFIAMLGSPAEAGLIKGLREVAVTAPIYLSSNFYFQRSWRAAVGPYADDVYFCGVTILNEKSSRAFQTAWAAKMGYAPSYQPAEAYDDIKLFAYAIEKSGYNGAAIRNVLVSVKGVPSALGGTITMGEDHYTIMTSTALWKAKNGKLVRVIPGKP